MSINSVINPKLLSHIQQLIEAARIQIAHYANSASVILYWQIGHRIKQDILKNERAAYGKEVIIQLATQLRECYGSGFERLKLLSKNEDNETVNLSM